MKQNCQNCANNNVKIFFKWHRSKEAETAECELLMASFKGDQILVQKTILT